MDEKKMMYTTNRVFMHTYICMECKKVQQLGPDCVVLAIIWIHKIQQSGGIINFIHFSCDIEFVEYFKQKFKI